MCNALKICKLGGTSESSIEYLDVSGMEDATKETLALYALQLKLTGEDVILGTQIAFSGHYQAMVKEPSVVTAISIDVTMPMTKYISSGQSDKQELTTLEEIGISALIGNLPRLTKEQFYTLE